MCPSLGLRRLAIHPQGALIILEFAVDPSHDQARVDGDPNRTDLVRNGDASMGQHQGAAEVSPCPGDQCGAEQRRREIA